MKPNSRQHDTGAPSLIISVSGGVADVLSKPRGAAVTIFDYDIDGVDDMCLDRDPDGNKCIFGHWPFDKIVLHDNG